MVKRTRNKRRRRRRSRRAGMRDLNIRPGMLLSKKNPPEITAHYFDITGQNDKDVINRANDLTKRLEKQLKKKKSPRRGPRSRSVSPKMQRWKNQLIAIRNAAQADRDRQTRKGGRRKKRTRRRRKRRGKRRGKQRRRTRRGGSPLHLRQRAANFLGDISEKWARWRKKRNAPKKAAAAAAAENAESAFGAIPQTTEEERAERIAKKLK